jgi:hypothetical protein
MTSVTEGGCGVGSCVGVGVGGSGPSVGVCASCTSGVGVGGTEVGVEVGGMGVGVGGAGRGVGVAKANLVGAGVWSGGRMEGEGVASPADVVSVTSPASPGAPQAAVTISSIETAAPISNFFIVYFSSSEFSQSQGVLVHCALCGQDVPRSLFTFSPQSLVRVKECLFTVPRADRMYRVPYYFFRKPYPSLPEIALAVSLILAP